MMKWCLLAAATTPAHCFVIVHAPRRAPSARSTRIYSTSAELQPFERPGNYVQPYGSALGVSAAAVLCGELIKVPGSVEASVSILGRLSALTSLPLIIASLAVLRSAARTGPELLSTPTYERLNLGVALASVAACIISPRPVVSVIIARVGTGLLCLEVWSKFSSAKAGDPISEVTSAVMGFARAVRRTIDLLIEGLEGDGDADPAATPRAVPACYAALSLAQIAIACVACTLPAALPAVYPIASPGLDAARTATSSAVIAAVCATTLADAAATRPPSGSGTALRPFRLLNRAMLASAATSIIVQVAAGAMGASALSVAALGGARTCAGVATVAAVHLATVAVCVRQDALWAY